MVQSLKFKNFLKKYSNIWPLIFLFLAIGVFASIQPVIVSPAGIQNILMAATLIALVGAGETLVVISGGIDLSPAYVMGLCAVVTALFMKYFATFLSPPIAIILGVFLGLLFSTIPGLINGLLVAKLKIPSFIATIGMMSIAHGGAYIANDGTPVSGLPRLISDIGNSDLFYYIPGEGFTVIRPEGFGSMKDLIRIIPIPVVFVAVLLVLIHFILHKTRYGRFVFSIGGNIDASRFAGIPVEKSLIKTYVLASLLYGIAGIVYTFRFGNAQPNMGQPMLLFAIGAVFIGGAGMTGGVGSLVGTVIGALMVATLQAGLSTLGVDSFYKYIAIGLVIIFAVLFDRMKHRLIQ